MSAYAHPDPGDGYPTDAKENPDQRPTPIPVNPDRISGKLISYPHWVCWRFAWRSERGEWSKVPINPTTGENARTNDPSETAGSFRDALTYHQREDTDTDGIGFVVTDSPFSGVDLDSLYDPATGEWDDVGRDILETLGSYSEFSPGARGGHTLLIGDLPEGSRKNDPVEMYDSGRYFTVTGHRIEGTPESIPDRETGEKRLASVHREYFPDDYTDDGQQDAEDDIGTPTGDVSGSVPLEDDELIEKAKNAKNGEKFSHLWDGSTADYKSHSEADLALCNLLAFWTGGDRDRIDKLFRRSDLMRGKWDDNCTGDGDTYGEHTIKKAIAKMTESYDPRPSGTPAPTDSDTDTIPWNFVRGQYAEEGRRAGRYYAAEALESRTAWMDVLEEDRLWVYESETGRFAKWGEQRAAAILEQGLGEWYSRSEKGEVIERLKARNQTHRDELNGGTQPGYHLCNGRERVDREACTSPVRIPWVCCDQHEPDDPTV